MNPMNGVHHSYSRRMHSDTHKLARGTGLKPR